MTEAFHVNKVCELPFLQQMKVCFNALKLCYDVSKNKPDSILHPPHKHSRHPHAHPSNNYVRVGGGTIFFWESDNPSETFPVIWLDLWKILCFRSNSFRRKMFDNNRTAPILLKPVPQRQASLVVQFYLSVTTSYRKLYILTSTIHLFIQF